ncbi:MAG: hypothetical protein F6K39_23160, partial [Okeania sp. SIO3B3]|nr:hypothetical protein [Okeania sp. SIO3B3]
ASQVAELAYDRLQETLAKLEEGDRWRNDLMARLERLEQTGALQEGQSSNLETELGQKLNQLESQLSKLENSEINNIKNWLTKLDGEINNMRNKISQFEQNQEVKTPDKNANNKKFIVISEEEQLLKDYNDPEKSVILSKNAITVSVTEESIDNSRLGVGKPIMRPKRRGNYWILKQGNSEYLVPSDTIIINEYSIEIMEKLFECQGINSEGYQDKFELLKPAKVSSIGEEKWQLSEPGKLIFTVQYSGLQLISTYQQNPRLLSRNAIEVWETDQSIDQRRLGGGQGAILQKHRKGNYWILNEGGIDYIVPRAGFKINEYNQETFANLFECQGYRLEYSGFKLIKPAIVSCVSRGEIWQLVESGVLQFY